MARRAPALLALVLLTAGCVGTGGEEIDPSATSTDPEERSELDVLLANATPVPPAGTTVDDWFVLEAETGPGAPLTAFEWVVPEGAVVPSNYIEDHDTVVLEVVPVLGEEVSLQDWGLLAFHEGAEGQELRAGLVGTTFEQRSRLAAFEEEASHEPAAEPTFLRLGLDDVDEGDTVTLVATARTEDPGRLGVAFRPLPVDPSFRAEPVEDLDELHAEEDPPAYELAVDGTGSGFQLGVYLDFNYLGAFGLEFWTPSVEIRERLPVDPRPAASARDLTLSTSFESASGWGSGAGFYFGSSGAGHWSSDVDVHGTTLEQDRPMVQAAAVPGGTLANLAFGYPLYGVTGAGEGGTTAQLDVTAAHANEFELLLFYHLDLGVTLEDLAGETAATGANTFDGLADGQRTLASLEDGTLHLTGPSTPTLVLQDLPAR